MQYIPCQNCGRRLPETWRWFICNGCGFRICNYCLDRHHEQYRAGLQMQPLPLRADAAGRGAGCIPG